MKWWEIIKEGGAVMSSGGATDSLFNVTYGGDAVSRNTFYEDEEDEDAKRKEE